MRNTNISKHSYLSTGIFFQLVFSSPFQSPRRISTERFFVLDEPCFSPKDLCLLLLFLASASYLFDDTVFSILRTNRTLFSALCSPWGSMVLVHSLQDTGISKWGSQVNFFVASLEPSHRRMESMETKSISDVRENIMRIFKDFMTGITKIDELGTAGSRLLTGFQQALEYIRGPPIDVTSELIDKIIKANETQRVKTYIEAGCRNPLDGVRNVNKMNSCKLGLLDHISKAKVIVEVLEGLLGDVTNSIRRTDGNSLPIPEKDSDDELNDHAIYDDTESNSQNVDVTQLAALMSIIYSMVKQDYLMQVTMRSS